MTGISSLELGPTSGQLDSGFATMRGNALARNQVAERAKPRDIQIMPSRLPAELLVETALNEDACNQWLSDCGIDNISRGFDNLQSIIDHTPDHLVRPLLIQLQRCLPNLSDSDRGLNNLERFWGAHAELDIGQLLQDQQKMNLGSLLTLFSASQFLGDVLVQDQASFEYVSVHSDQLLSREFLVNEVNQLLDDARDSKDAMTQLRVFKQRQIARIACGDLIHQWRLEQVTDQISFLAEAICQSAYQWARRRLTARWGRPLTPSKEEAEFVVLALGKLGGTELNYSSDIDLVMVYESEGKTDGSPPRTNRQFFEQLSRDIVNLLGEPTFAGPAYRVDLRLRPGGSRGSICSSVQSLLHYYDFQGRTWERQALIKAKPVAGGLELGDQLLKLLSPWIYHRNLNRADIAGIKALKRRIERRAIVKGESDTNIKTGHGGIRDIEFVIQFLQLLNGGELPEVRTAQTLDAIGKLEAAGCLSAAEGTLLSQNYRWLRKLEHRLQLMFDLQTHSLPQLDSEQQKIALRMGFSGTRALPEFKKELASTRESNRTILNHLLHSAFGMTFGSLRDSGGHLAFATDQAVPAEVDLILEREPDPELIATVLQRYGFHDVALAFDNLMDLATENTAFLSSRRCHHFLAAIAPSLLREIAATPDPDATLLTLANVSDSLGAKGVLWELFSFNPPTLNLYVRLCSTSDYLVGILKSNPGMIDELMDALQVAQLPSFEFLRISLLELVNGAEDIEPIVHSFKNAQHLCVGIRDILGRDSIQKIHRTLSDIAEVCLQTVVAHELAKLILQLEIRVEGFETDADYHSELEDIIPFVVLGLGKLGGREPNYHSDLDLIFLYRKDQEFESRLPSHVSSQSFFSELAANVIRSITHSQQHGRLFELDCRLRPTGKSGSLAVSMEEFARYFRTGQGWLWERQALCKSRDIFGSSEMRKLSSQLVRQAIVDVEWNPEMAKEIDTMRLAMEQDCSDRNLKRGKGGTVDVEFAIQAMQLKHARDNGSLLFLGTLAAIEELESLGILNRKSGRTLAENYQFLRSVEARLRLINTTARHDLPAEGVLLRKLAFLLNFSSAADLCESVETARSKIRDQYTAVFSCLASSR